MKFNILIILVIQYAMAFGQGSFEIKPTSVWKIDKLINVISTKDKRCEGDETFKLFIKGDTIINALNYFKIYKSGVLYLDPIFEYTNQYNGAIRQVDNKVYYIEKSKSTEELLYNYNLKISDTIRGKIANGKIVLDIDTLSDGRKLFQISKSMLHAMNAYIIEGIGTSGGLLSEPPVGHYMYDDNYLICYSENNLTTYNGIDPLNSGCYLNLSRFPINPTGIWYVDYVSYCYPETIKNGDDIFEYFINNDTIINSRKYFKLYKSGIAYYNEPFYYDSIYVGALRDENNKFFYIDKSETAEKMLYDFDLKVGDTISSPFGNGYRVSKIDTLPDGRKIISYRAEICAGCCPMNDFIEGIGHWGGIMQEPPCLHPCFSGYYLLCYKENDELIYSNDFFGMFKIGCDKRTFIPFINKNSELKITPVPVKDNVILEFSKSFIGNTLINIYDIDGRNFMSRKFFICESQNIIQLNLSNLKSGIYIVTVNFKNSNIIGKIIKE